MSNDEQTPQKSPSGGTERRLSNDEQPSEKSPSEGSLASSRESAGDPKPSEPSSSAASGRSAGISKKAKTAIAVLTAVVGLSTGILTLREQIFGGDSSPASAPGGPDNVGVITSDAEAKSRANRVSDVLKECMTTTGRDYQGCSTAGILAASHIPIGFGVGSVEVDATSPTTFELTSRSESGQVFWLQNTVEGEQVRKCTPPGTGGCPEDGRW